jgi:hypothetical protein
MSDVENDLSADTGRFQAFAQRQDDLPAPWHMRVPGSKIGLLVGIIVAVAVLAAIVAVLLVG